SASTTSPTEASPLSQSTSINRSSPSVKVADFRRAKGPPVSLKELRLPVCTKPAQLSTKTLRVPADYPPLRGLKNFVGRPPLAPSRPPGRLQETLSLTFCLLQFGFCLRLFAFLPPHPLVISPPLPKQSQHFLLLRLARVFPPRRSHRDQLVDP